MKKELRFIDSLDIDNRIVSGYAIVFNKISEVLSDNNGIYREIILPSAITQKKLDTYDIVFCYSHDSNLILARSNKGRGTLKCSIDDKGVRFEFECPNSYLGDFILEALRRGDLNKCSFRFWKKKDRWEKKQEPIKLRYIEEFAGISDMCIVVHPAYPQTSAIGGIKTRDVECMKKLERMAKEAGLDWKPGQQKEKRKKMMQKAYIDANMIIPNRWK